MGGVSTCAEVCEGSSSVGLPLLLLLAEFVKSCNVNGFTKLPVCFFCEWGKFMKIAEGKKNNLLASGKIEIKENWSKQNEIVE